MGSYLSNFPKFLAYFPNMDKDGLTALDLALAASRDKRLAEVAHILTRGWK